MITSSAITTQMLFSTAGALEGLVARLSCGFEAEAGRAVMMVGAGSAAAPGFGIPPGTLPAGSPTTGGGDLRVGPGVGTGTGGGGTDWVGKQPFLIKP